MTSALLFFLLLGEPALELAQRAFVEGERALEQREHERAIEIFGDGLEAAAAIEDPNVRRQAVAAMHFQSATAFHALGDRDAVRHHLEEFLLVTPGAALDPAKFDPELVRQFDLVSTTLRSNPAPDFDALYPGFRHFHPKPRAPGVIGWDGTPEYAFLATAAEKREWQDLPAGGAQQQFIDRFWDRRDPNPLTLENEFRLEFQARVRFADEAFAGTDGIRGALSDRGRAFILLGKPRAIRTRALRESEGKVAMIPTVLQSGATVELWAYFPDQLPIRVRGRELEFKFITERKFGDHSLDRSTYNVRALGAAAEQAIRRE